MRNSSGNPIGTATFDRLRIGGGGLCLRLSTDATGATMTVTMDTSASMIKTSGDWFPAFTPDTLPSGEYADSPGFVYGGETGGYEMVVAPNDPATIYGTYQGRLFRTNNTGTNWVRTAVPTQNLQVNGAEIAMMTAKIAVDPTNKNIFIFGTQNDGLYYSLDGGTSVTNIVQTTGLDYKTGVPAPFLVACDPTSAVVSGQHQRWVYHRYGTGIYETTTGLAGTWTLISGSPAKLRHMQFASDGKLWCIATDTNWGTVNYPLYKQNNQGAAFTNFTASPWAAAQEWRPFSLAIDPANPNAVYLMVDGSITFTLDGGATWKSKTGGYAYVRAATTTRWALNPNTTYVVQLSILVKPGTNEIWMAEGVGVSKMVAPTNNYTTLPLIEQFAGIEQLVGTHFLSVPNGPMIYNCWDKSVWAFPNGNDGRPIGPYNFNGNSIQHGWHADYAKDTPTFIACNTGWETMVPIYSTDSGRTWNDFPALSDQANAGVGGSIAALTPNDLILAPQGNGIAVKTHNAGATWTPLNIPGLPATINGAGGSGWGLAYYFHRHILTVDKTNNDVYIYNFGGGADPTVNQGIWKSSNLGDTWTRVYSSKLNSNDQYHAKLRSVPGQTGHLFWTSGRDQQFDVMKRSVNGGVTWTDVPNTLEIFDIGFGKAAPGKTYPTIFVYGKISGVKGLYRSDDNCATWLLLTRYPDNRIDLPASISGDLNVYGRVWGVYTGASGYCGDYSFKLTSAPSVTLPANSSIPVISGNTTTGQVLTTTNGTWFNTPTSYTYVWKRSGIGIAGATASSYTLVQADVGTNISVTVTAVNAAGSQSSTSNSVGPVLSLIQPPANSVLPVITGTAQQGQILTSSTGTWTNSPTYTYVWKRAGTAISGATASTYTLINADVGNIITVSVTATNAGGAATATSNGAGPIAGIIPVNSVAPAISGLTATGQTLTSSNGTWTNNPTSYTYVWKRDGAAISGATSATYLLVSADLGTTITVTVTANNANGSGTSTSTGVGPITVPASPPVNSAIPVITGTVTSGQILTTSNGTWSNSPSYTYQWKRGGTAISGATASTYVLAPADVGTNITVTVTATNTGGSASSTSAAVGPVTDSSVPVPAQTLGVQAVSDTNPPKTGQRPYCFPGVWSNNPTAYYYQWNKNGTPIPGETASNMLLTSDYLGAMISVTSRAQNTGGSGSSTSPAIGPVVSSAFTTTPSIITDGSPAVGKTVTFNFGAIDGDYIDSPKLLDASTNAVVATLGSTAYTLLSAGTFKLRVSAKVTTGLYADSAPITVAAGDVITAPVISFPADRVSGSNPPDISLAGGELLDKNTDTVIIEISRTSTGTFTVSDTITITPPWINIATIDEFLAPQLSNLAAGPFRARAYATRPAIGSDAAQVTPYSSIISDTLNAVTLRAATTTFDIATTNLNATLVNGDRDLLGSNNYGGDYRPGLGTSVRSTPKFAAFVLLERGPTDYGADMRWGIAPAGTDSQSGDSAGAIYTEQYANLNVGDELVVQVVSWKVGATDGVLKLYKNGTLLETKANTLTSGILYYANKRGSNVRINTGQDSFNNIPPGMTINDRWN